LNPGLSLPSNNIVVVHRSDGSGTAFVWTDYLSKVSSEWSNRVGKSKSIPWPTGIGAPGNEGVANAIKGTANTIGYIELAYALTTKMSYAFIQNKAGKFIEPSLESTKSAVSASAPQLPKGDGSWSSVSIVDASGDASYPIASFTYALVYKDLSTNPGIDQSKAKALTNFFSWAITDGQKLAPRLGYFPLPDQVIKLDQDTLKFLTFHGKPLS
jgi:phosphate transport system substrate-binding protein